MITISIISSFSFIFLYQIEGLPKSVGTGCSHVALNSLAVSLICPIFVLDTRRQATIAFMIQNENWVSTKKGPVERIIHDQAS